MNLIITILSVANEVHDRRARKLLRAAALRLAEAQWRAESPSPQRRCDEPTLLPLRTPGRATRAHSNGNGHA
jgi:hypothetical protein